MHFYVGFSHTRSHMHKLTNNSLSSGHLDNQDTFKSVETTCSCEPICLDKNHFLASILVQF